MQLLKWLLMPLAGFFIVMFFAVIPYGGTYSFKIIVPALSIKRNMAVAISEQEMTVFPKYLPTLKYFILSNFKIEVNIPSELNWI